MILDELVVLLLQVIVLRLRNGLVGLADALIRVCHGRFFVSQLSEREGPKEKKSCSKTENQNAMNQDTSYQEDFAEDWRHPYSIVHHALHEHHRSNPASEFTLQVGFLLTEYCELAQKLGIANNDKDEMSAEIDKQRQDLNETRLQLSRFESLYTQLQALQTKTENQLRDVTSELQFQEGLNACLRRDNQHLREKVDQLMKEKGPPLKLD